MPVPGRARQEGTKVKGWKVVNKEVAPSGAVRWFLENDDGRDAVVLRYRDGDTRVIVGKVELLGGPTREAVLKTVEEYEGGVLV